MKQKLKVIDNNSFLFKCEDDDIDKGQWLDTRVYLNDNFFCWIAGDDIDNFIKDFKIFITKYRI